MLLEGAMASLASLALTVMPPGPVFKDSWKLYIARGKMTSVRGDNSGHETMGIKSAMEGREAALKGRGAAVASQVA